MKKAPSGHARTAAYDWILVANGPGEVSAHACPMAKEIRGRFPHARITLILVPCQFASGHEADIARKAQVIDQIIPPAEYRQLIFQKQKLKEMHFSRTGVIIFLGGDPYHAVLLQKKLNYPGYAYFEKKPRLEDKFRAVFTPHTAGNLMVDSVDDCTKYAGRSLSDKNVTVALFPGSRQGYIEYMVPFLAEAARIMVRTLPHLHFYWGIPLHLQATAAKKFPKELKEFPLYQTCESFDLMVTLLGTNTALYAVQGVPMLVLFPFNRPDLIPLMGLAGILARIPMLGVLIQRLALSIASKRIGFTALPNMIAKKEVTPELKGYFTPADVANKCLELLGDKPLRDRISKELRTTMGKGGAARYIIDTIIEKEGMTEL